MMFRKLGFLVLSLGLTLPVWAADRSSAISGCVRNANGVPQLGALVEVLNSAAQSLATFTDENGFYSFEGLTPGIYRVRVSAPSFLPALRERVNLHAGNRVLVNLTLNTLFDALKMGPVNTPAQEDDWKWVLRSVSNRPILRLVDDKPTVVLAEKSTPHEIKGSFSFVAGSSSDGFTSSSDSGAGFSVERSIFSSDTIGLRGNLGYGTASPAGVLRASYSHKMQSGAEPTVALSMLTLPAPEMLPGGGLQALSLTTSDQFTMGDVLELKFGSQLQSVQFLGHVTAFRPFGSAELHLSPNTILEYRYTTTEPEDRLEQGLDSLPADFAASGPRVSMVGYAPAVEHAHHQEIALSRHIGKNSVQFAAYYDRIADPALTGVGELSTDSGNVLPDVYSGTFTYQGQDLRTNGVRIVVQRQLTSALRATMDYGYGGVLDLNGKSVNLQDAQDWMSTCERHTLAGKLDGKLPKTKTQWVASYRWINGSALTPVDLFNNSPGRADPYLNLFLRQPIPSPGFFPGHIEAVVDLRNLLAEGYVPVIGHDGRTVYLVQAARAVRGGLNFTF